MVMVEIPSLAEVGAGISHVANGACDLASNAVQEFVNSPSLAQAGLNVLAAQIEVLEQLVAKLQTVAAGIDGVHSKLALTQQWEWHSPAGQTFRDAVSQRQIQAKNLEQTAIETAQLARQGIDELRAIVASLQSLLATARVALGASVAGAVSQVCS